MDNFREQVIKLGKEFTYEELESIEELYRQAKCWRFTKDRIHPGNMVKETKQILEYVIKKATS